MDGIININKPAGMSSFSCVAAVRRILGVKKAGHAGTLDPQATGVLPVCVGRATKLSELFLTCPKKYRGRVLFGVSTDTQDVWGQTLSTSGAGSLTDADVFAAASGFRGCISQVPPAYSALKIDGVPMYKKARRGQEVQAEARSVNVYEFEVSSLTPAEEDPRYGVTVREAEIDVTCSRGTYIRTLCYDLGRAVGVDACMSALCRTAYGPLAIEEALSLEELAERGETAISPAEVLLANYPLLTLEKAEFEDFINGRPLVVAPERVQKGESRLFYPEPEAGAVALKYEDTIFAIARGTDPDVRGTDPDMRLRSWKYLGGI